LSHPPGVQTARENHRARAFYHWRKPEAKERHGFAMGVVQVEAKTDEAVIAALRKAYPQLESFVVELDKLEWR